MFYSCINSPFKTIADLKGARLLSHLHRDMVLLPAWLSTMLAASNLPQAERFFGSITPCDKVNQVVLPVFFRHADGACLERQNWETAVELNPQLGRNLHILSVSPKVIPIAICFRRNLNANARTACVDAMLRIASSTAGKQITAFYGAHGFATRPTSCMNGTLELVRQYERISAQQSNSRKGKP